MQKLKKYKIARRLGPGIFEKTQTDKYMLREARRGKGQRPKRRRVISDYSKQLLEKQKVRFTYGISEKQFRKYVEEAEKATGSASTVLFSTLETRLDNVVYRLGLAPTRRAARQMVSHGHVLVNGKRIRIPSYTVSKDDKVTVREGSQGSALFQSRKEELEKYKQPSWLSFDPKSMLGTIVGVPSLEESPQSYDLTQVIEFYSR